MSTFTELFEALPFQPIDPTSAFCEVAGCPVKMTILGDAPLSLLFGFFVGFKSTPPTSPALQSIPAAQRVDLSLEDGVVWLSLFGLANTSGGAIAESVKGIVAELKSVGFEFEAVCGLCGAGNTPVSLQFGQPVRVCAACLDAQARQTEELNRFKLGDMWLLPLASLGVIAGWMVVWLLIDLFIDWLNGPGNPRLELNEMTMLPLVAAGFLMFVLGRQLGGLFKGSGVSHTPVLIAGIMVTLLAVAVGEVCYIATTIFRLHGLFDVFLAAQLFLPWLAGYAPSWWVLKVCLTACLLFGGITAAKEKLMAPLIPSDPTTV